jgi:hypothetical protein
MIKSTANEGGGNPPINFLEKCALLGALTTIPYCQEIVGRGW